MYPDSQQYQGILSDGFGLQVRPICIQYGDCYCHSGAGVQTKLLAKTEEIGVIIAGTRN